MSATFFIQIANTIILLTIIAIPFAAMILFQIYLSKKENKWYGRILPIITGALSIIVTLLVILGMGFYTVQSPATGYVIEGQLIEQTIPEPTVIHQSGSILGIIALGLMIFVFMNIPTIVFSIIYKKCRKKFIEEEELKKMNIQDLD